MSEVFYKKQPLTDLQTFLQNELVRRTRQNPNYSLRAFARQLKLEPSVLSKILRGKRRITVGQFGKIVENLKLPPAHIEALSEGEFGPLGQATPQFLQITEDTFEVISDWYHYAILELTHLENFKPSIASISRILGIKKTEASAAVARLERIGYLHVHSDGRWEDRAKDITNFSEGMTSRALRNLQKQLLEKALQSIDTQHAEIRSHTSMTMAINPKKLPEARELIRKFRRQLNQLLSGTQPLEKVYNLSVALYPLTQGSEE